MFASAFLLLRHLSNKQTQKTNKHPLLLPHMSLLLYPSISLLSFIGKLILRVVYSHCLHTSSNYRLIQIGFFCSPLHWDHSQLLFPALSSFLGIPHLHIQLPIDHLHMVINQLFQSEQSETVWLKWNAPSCQPVPFFVFPKP